MEQTDNSIIDAALKWRSTMESGDVTEAEKAAFRTWLQAKPQHMKAYEHAERFWAGLAALSHEDITASLPVQSLNQKIGSRLFDRFMPAGHFSDNITNAAAKGIIATMAVLVAVSALYLGSEPTGRQPQQYSYETAMGEVREIQLDDGSVLTLGAESKIDVTFSENRRRASLLAGDAYFNVASNADKPFDVRAGNMNVHVIGTSFDIRFSNTTTQLSVAEGVVNVSYPLVFRRKVETNAAKQSKIPDPALRTFRRLVTGERITASSSDGLKPVETINPNMIGAWRNKRLVYFDAPLSDVISDINRYQNQPVVIKDAALNSLTVSATFDAQDIDQLLSTLSDVFALTIDTADSGIITLKARE